MTYYHPDSGDFAALGHGVSSKSGNLLQVFSGSIFDARVRQIKKGETGHPGQLIGEVTNPDPIGQIRKNTAQGIFGTLETQKTASAALPVADRSEIHTGKATIRSTLETGVQEYSVEILKIYPNAPQRTRNMLIKVTDPALLETTGGIVQGMSGSPIIQDGKLVGAVTHVLVNDPTTGYGIFIENMLDAAA